MKATRLKSLYRSIFLLTSTLLAFTSLTAMSANKYEPLPVPNYKCPSIPNMSKSHPYARQVQGQSAQSGFSARVLLGSKGREAFKKEHAKGGSAAGLRLVREKAMLKSIACGPDDDLYRNGVCMTFTLQCIKHGGGNCGLCTRAWAAQFCTTTLSKIALTPERKLKELKSKSDPDKEWKKIEALAKKTREPDLLKRLNDAKRRFIKNPVKQNCYKLF